MSKKRFISILVFLSLCFFADRGISKVLLLGINNYFGLNQQSQVLLIGHSHLMLAVDKKELESAIRLKVSKYCREGVNVYDKQEMVKQYLQSPVSDSLQYVFYGVDQFMFTGEGLSESSYKLFYPFMDIKIIDKYIGQNTKSLYDYWSHKLIHSTRYSDALINSAMRGWRNDWTNKKYGLLDVKQLKKQLAENRQRKILFNPELMVAFEETLKYITQKRIHVILINTPIAQPFNEYEPEEYQRIISYFKTREKENPYVHYWDYNPEFSDKYELFFDPIHLNPKGQQKITKKIINDFHHNTFQWSID